MKAILMSIRPEWVAKILNGEKTIEVRKRFPSDYVGWVYIYCTKDEKYTLERNTDEPYDFFTLKDKKHLVFKLDKNHCGYNGKVVARFWCDKVEEILARKNTKWYHLADTVPMCDGDIYHICQKSCLSQDELHNYLKSKRGKAIHIIELEIFNKPKEISEFYKVGYNYKLMFALNTQNKVFRERRVADVQYDYKLTRAPQSWQFIEV